MKQIRNMRSHNRLPRLRTGLLLALFLVAMPASAQQPTWYLLPREQGCADLKILIRMERLPRAPVSPEDFARMMRERGEQVVVGPLPDTPREYIGKIVQVKYGNGRSPVFVTEEICGNVEQGRRTKPGNPKEPGANN